VKVLIIPEDQTHDGFIIKPILEALLSDASIPSRVDVLPEPQLRGASFALNPATVAEIVADNPMVDVFVLVVDLDCDRQGHQAKAAAREAEHEGRLIACLAKQEVEVWMLALYRERLDTSWNDVRSHCDLKEAFAEPLLERLGTDGPGEGRKRAMRALSGRLQGLLAACDELADLKARLVEHRSRPKR